MMERMLERTILACPRFFVNPMLVRLQLNLLQDNASNVSLEIYAKYEHLLWQQQLRIRQGRVSRDPKSIWWQDLSTEVRLRNRYADIFPWANCRIRLKVPEGTCDYINASPILLSSLRHGETKRYITTQVGSVVVTCVDLGSDYMN